MKDQQLFRFLGQLEQKIKKDFGTRCPDFCLNCCVCQAWLALDILKDLYSPEGKNNKRRQ